MRGASGTTCPVTTICHLPAKKAQVSSDPASVFYNSQQVKGQTTSQLFCPQCPAVPHQRWRTPTCLGPEERNTRFIPSSATSASPASGSATPLWSAAERTASGRSPGWNAPMVRAFPPAGVPLYLSCFSADFLSLGSERQTKNTAEEREECSQKQHLLLKNRKRPKYIMKKKIVAIIEFVGGLG